MVDTVLSRIGAALGRYLHPGYPGDIALAWSQI